MKRLQILFLICGMLGFAFIPNISARSQVENPCETVLVSSEVSSTDILDCLRAGQAVDIDGAEIKGDLNLTSLPGDPSGTGIITITNRVTISNSHITGSLVTHDPNNGISTVFQDGINLKGSRFDKKVDFSNTTFKEFANFNQATFGDVVDFTQTNFEQGTSFLGSTFENEAIFFITTFSGGADFSAGHFRDTANFLQSHFIEGFDASFIKTEFLGPALFFSAIFDDQALFSDAEFSTSTSFEQSIFKKAVSFHNAKFSRQTPEDVVSFKDAALIKLDLSNASFENEQLEISPGEYELDMPDFNPVILVIKDDIKGLPDFLMNNFRKQGKQPIVNAIAYWQKHTEVKGWSAFTRIVNTIFLDWTFGYGYKPLNAIIASIILILLFAIGYYPKGTLRPVPLAPSKPRERKFTIRLTEIPIAHDDETPSPNGNNQRTRPLPAQFIQTWQAILFSAGVFTKISPGNYIATRARSLVIAEWIIGLVMMAGFLYSLANTNPFVRSLLNILG